MIAFVFPGQGSQSVGMGRALVESYGVARRTFEEANDALGFSIEKLCFEGPADQLQLTANAQPAILTASIATLRALEAEASGLRADIVAGHSLGEYTALVAAGSLKFADAVRLVNLRGQYMQEAVPAGAGSMAAIIGLDEAGVAALCEEAKEGDVLEPANFNGGGQIVIAGAAAAVKRALAVAKSKKARALPLKVSAPFHCSMMQPAAERLAQALETIDVCDPKVAVVSNVEATSNIEGRRVKDLLYRQVTAPVRWEMSVKHMQGLGLTRMIEVGPGRVLSGLAKRIDRSLPMENVGGPEQIAALASQEGADS